MKQDKQKFDAADVDQDGAMTLMEFTSFLYPYDFENMHHVEIDLTIQQLDKNKDGKLNLKEFVGEGERVEIQLALLLNKWFILTS